MEKTIDTLRKIVSTSITKEEASAKIEEHYPQVSATTADKVRDDVHNFINGKIHKAELGLFLSESGLVVED